MSAGFSQAADHVARSVLAGAPGALLVGCVFQLLFAALWRRRFPEARFRWVPSLVMLVLLMAGAGAVIALSKEPVNETWFVEAWLLWPSLGTFQLVIMRLWMLLSVRTAFSWAHLLAMLLFVAPALPIVGGVSGPAFDDVAMQIWFVPGYGGGVAGAVFLVLLIEGLVRGSSVTRRRA